MLTTLPNLLTLSRIAAIPLVIATFYVPSPYGPWAGCVLFAIAGVTDWLPGRSARAPLEAAIGARPLLRSDRRQAPRRRHSLHVGGAPSHFAPDALPRA